MAQLISSTVIASLNVNAKGGDKTETDWFDGKKFVPHHVGVYEKRFREGSGSVYQHWNGKFWGQYSTNVARALGYKDNLSDYQNLDWRGLRYGSVEGLITE